MSIPYIKCQKPTLNDKSTAGAPCSPGDSHYGRRFRPPDLKWISADGIRTFIITGLTSPWRSGETNIISQNGNGGRERASPKPCRCTVKIPVVYNSAPAPREQLLLQRQRGVRLTPLQRRERIASAAGASLRRHNRRRRQEGARDASKGISVDVL
jgi:hypothetical protein